MTPGLLSVAHRLGAAWDRLRAIRDDFRVWRRARARAVADAPEPVTVDAEEEQLFRRLREAQARKYPVRHYVLHHIVDDAPVLACGKPLVRAILDGDSSTSSWSRFASALECHRCPGCEQAQARGSSAGRPS